VLGEIAEIMGAEHLLAARASTPAAAAHLLRIVNRVEAEGDGARSRHPRARSRPWEHPRAG
jgi:altronate dehydratase